MSQNEAPIDGRIRIRCKTCGELSDAIYRYFPGDVHLAKSYDGERLSCFFLTHVNCLGESGLPELEFIAD